MTYKITVDDLLQDLELAKQIAIKNSNANSLVTAVMAQAKLLGIDGKQTIPEPEAPVFNIIGVSPNETDYS